MNVEEFRKLPEQGSLDPNRIRTMQNNIKSDFRDKRTVEQMVSDLKSGKLKPENIKAIAVAEINGKVYTLDHRRLVAHRLAGRPVSFKKATPQEIKKSLTNRKMTTKDDGQSIEIK